MADGEKSAANMKKGGHAWSRDTFLGALLPFTPLYKRDPGDEAVYPFPPF